MKPSICWAPSCWGFRSSFYRPGICSDAHSLLFGICRTGACLPLSCLQGLVSVRTMMGPGTDAAEGRKSLNLSGPFFTCCEFRIPGIDSGDHAKTGGTYI